jgi:leucyl/phenylalanyl-tRNA--protein transferase
MAKRVGQQGTWITNDMKKAYLELHNRGLAKSYEVWEKDALVGGLYGIDLGHVFCGESMFSSSTNASKFAFIHLAQELEIKKYRLIDCQMYTKHLESLGAEEISRKEFLELLKS